MIKRNKQILWKVNDRIFCYVWLFKEKYLIGKSNDKFIDLFMVFLIAGRPFLYTTKIIIVFNIFLSFFQITGIIILSVGVSVKAYYSDYSTFLDTKYFSTPNLLIAIGAIIFLISFLGCYGAIKENYCMIIAVNVDVIYANVFLILRFLPVVLHPFDFNIHLGIGRWNCGICT